MTTKKESATETKNQNPKTTIEDINSIENPVITVASLETSVSDKSSIRVLIGVFLTLLGTICTAFFLFSGTVVTAIATNWDKIATSGTPKAVEIQQAKEEARSEERGRNSIQSIDDGLKSIETFKIYIDSREMPVEAKEKNKKTLDEAAKLLTDKRAKLIDKYKLLNIQIKNRNPDSKATENEIFEIVKDAQTEVNKKFATDDLSGLRVAVNLLPNREESEKIDFTDNFDREFEQAYIDSFTNKIRRMKFANNPKVRKFQLNKVKNTFERDKKIRDGFENSMEKFTTPQKEDKPVKFHSEESQFLCGDNRELEI